MVNSLFSQDSTSFPSLKVLVNAEGFGYRIFLVVQMVVSPIPLFVLLFFTRKNFICNDLLRRINRFPGHQEHTILHQKTHEIPVHEERQTSPKEGLFCRAEADVALALAEARRGCGSGSERGGDGGSWAVHLVQSLRLPHVHPRGQHGGEAELPGSDSSTELASFQPTIAHGDVVWIRQVNRNFGALEPGHIVCLTYELLSV